jgi:hypothetical protein
MHLLLRTSQKPWSFHRQLRSHYRAELSWASRSQSLRFRSNWQSTQEDVIGLHARLGKLRPGLEEQHEKNAIASA